jgi:hypothetical protein
MRTVPILRRIGDIARPQAVRRDFERRGGGVDGHLGSGDALQAWASALYRTPPEEQMVPEEDSKTAYSGAENRYFLMSTMR